MSGLIWIQMVWHSDGIPERTFWKHWFWKKSADDKKACKNTVKQRVNPLYTDRFFHSDWYINFWTFYNIQVKVLYEFVIIHHAKYAIKNLTLMSTSSRIPQSECVKLEVKGNHVLKSCPLHISLIQFWKIFHTHVYLIKTMCIVQKVSDTLL